MSGHSKWAKIHRAKGETDAKRGKIFQKLAKEIYVAAKGNPDLSTNSSLRMVVDKAKSANMPKDNIENAIKKASGKDNTENFDSIRYEGYGPSGVAVIVDALTDNKNRTASFVRTEFTKSGGNLGTDGSVSYMFTRSGFISIEDKYDEDELMMVALDAGASDFSHEDDTYEIITTPEDFDAVKTALNEVVDKFLESEITLIPNNYVEVSEEVEERVMKLIDHLEDLDDVVSVYHNLK